MKEIRLRLTRTHTHINVYSSIVTTQANGKQRLIGKKDQIKKRCKFTPLKTVIHSHYYKCEFRSTLDEKITCKDYYIPSSIYTIFIYFYNFEVESIKTQTQNIHRQWNWKEIFRVILPFLMSIIYSENYLCCFVVGKSLDRLERRKESKRNSFTKLDETFLHESFFLKASESSKRFHASFFNFDVGV